VQGDTHHVYRGHSYVTYGDPDNKSLYDEWVETAKPAFAHAALFNEKTTTIKDPTKDGASKNNANNKYTHKENQLTLQKDWTTHLRGMNPSSYMKLVQHTELGVAPA
jgi:hypothetical protein